ncbi:hypothetical protein AALP_AAs70065U000200 [Arabis alpina]|uniref:Uncharacterized protein n=1 Tax=Arabis alpina TaxID=50452 RepID=A0A087FWC7_ARAAL|nr:hypothetical protein AALP_AAs70065U000200 [Arabis alpina]
MVNVLSSSKVRFFSFLTGEGDRSDKKSHGDIDESKVKAPNMFERAEEEFDAVIGAIHQQKSSRDDFNKMEFKSEKPVKDNSYLSTNKTCFSMDMRRVIHHRVMPPSALDRLGMFFFFYDIGLKHLNRNKGHEPSGEKERHKSKKEVMEEIIIKSKLGRMEKGKHKEEKEKLMDEMKSRFEEGKDVVVSIMSSMGEEQICAVKEVGGSK